jgi:hypothetical protein
MKPFAQFPEKRKKKVRYVLTDIDDTLTNNGRLPAVAYHAMERLQDAGISVIPLLWLIMPWSGFRMPASASFRLRAVRQDGVTISHACGR